jgi:OmpA-like transmembrane domain
MTMKTAGIVLLTAVTAGCATGSKKWEPSRLAPDPNVYAGAALGSSSYDQSVQEIDTIVRQQFAGFGLPVATSTPTFDDSDFAYGAVLGYRFAPFFGGEIAYFDLGDLKYNSDLTVNPIGLGATLPASASFNIKVSGVGASALAYLPLSESWELYGRGGVLFTNTEIEFVPQFQGQTGGGSFSGNSTDLYAGVGGSYRLGEAFTFRVEFQRFINVGNSDTTEFDLDFVTFQVMYMIL